MNKVFRWILLLLCMGTVWSSFWPLFLGIARARSGFGIADYGPLLALALLLWASVAFMAWLICHNSN
jgi:hypothetical protein